MTTEKTKKKVFLTKKDKKERRRGFYLCGLTFITHLLKTISAEYEVESYKNSIKQGSILYEDAERFSDLLNSIEDFKDVTPKDFLLNTDDKLDRLKEAIDEREECYKIFKDTFGIQEKEIKDLIEQWKKDNEVYTRFTLLQLSAVHILSQLIYYFKGLISKKEIEKDFKDLKHFPLVPLNVFTLTRRLVFDTTITVSNFFKNKIEETKFDVDNEEHQEWLKMIVVLIHLSTTHSEREGILLE